MSGDEASFITPMTLNNNSKLPAKPAHLITLKTGTKQEFFIALDLPDISCVNWVKAKGFYHLKDTKENYLAAVSKVLKEDVVEIYFPVHRVQEIQNLKYKSA